MKKVPPSQVTGEQIAALLAGEGMGEDEPVSLLVRLAVKRIVEEALEGAVRDILGREYYARRGEGRGYRNGYRKGRLATGEGEVSYAIPQVREADATAIAELRERLSGRTEALEKLAIEMYARGCSTRDIEAIFADEQGRSLLSRTAVSEVTEALWEEYEAFATRDLSEIKPLFLFLDGVAEKLQPGARREAVLAAWCITWEGRKVLVHLAPGSKESTDCAVEFLEDCTRRGLSSPVLVVTDGAAGLIRAVETCFPSSLRQRCLAHKMRNIAAKLPDAARAEVTQAARAAYQAPSPALARVLRDDLVERYQRAYPTAVRCFLEDFEACIAHLACPPAVRKVIRTANLLERLFEEERRRTRTIHSFFGERPVLKLMYASVIRASDSWRGIRIGELELGQLERLRDQLIDKHKEATKKPKAESPGSAPSPFYSKDRT